MDAKTVSVLNALSMYGFPRTAYRFAKRLACNEKGCSYGFIKVYDDLCAKADEIVMVAGANGVRADTVVEVKLDSNRYIGRAPKVMLVKGRNIEGRELAVLLKYSPSEHKMTYAFGGSEQAKELYDEKAPLVLVPPADWPRALLWAAYLRIAPYELSKTTFLPPVDGLKEAIENAVFIRKKDIILEMVINNMRALLQSGVSVDEIAEAVKEVAQETLASDFARKLMPKRYYDQLASAAFDAVLKMLLDKSLDEDRAVFVVADKAYEALYRELKLPNVFIVKAPRSFTDSAVGRAALLSELGITTRESVSITERRATEEERRLAERIAQEILVKEEAQS